MGDHPPQFWARPKARPDGSTDLMVWDAGIPGKEGTIWEGGVYTVKLAFPEDYPAAPPKVSFFPPLFHPNVYPCGKVCLSILDPAKAWRPSITLKTILSGVQDLLDNP